jgi:hypothetical protein
MAEYPGMNVSIVAIPQPSVKSQTAISYLSLAISFSFEKCIKCMQIIANKFFKYELDMLRSHDLTSDPGMHCLGTSGLPKQRTINLFVSVWKRK